MSQSVQLLYSFFDYLPIAFYTALCLAAMALPIFSAINTLRRNSRLKIFMDKLSQQAATLSIFIAAFLVLSLVAAIVYIMFFRKDIAAFWLSFPFPSLFLGGLLLISCLTLAAYRALWRTMRNIKAAHALLGLLAGLFWGGLFLVGILYYIMDFQEFNNSSRITSTGLPSIALATNFFAEQPATLAFPAAAIIFAFSLAAGMNIIYMIIRRHKDDFGRDYYQYSLRYCARWAIVCALPQLFLFFWLSIRGAGPFLPQVFFQLPLFLLIASLLFFVLACLIWAGMAFSNNPSRLKISAILAPILLILSLSGFMAGFF